MQQNELTRQTVQNQMIYNMLKDGRSVTADWNANRASVADIFATMQAIYIQRQLKTIPDEIWPVFHRDHCALLARPTIIRRSWEEMNKAPFSPEFIQYVDRLSRPNCGDQP